MIKIYNYTNTFPHFIDVIVNDMSITQIEYCNYEIDYFDHITLYDDEQREFCHIVFDEFVTI